MSVNKICEKTVTEAIVKALENADRMKSVIIIYETNEDEKNSHGVILQSDTTLAGANYMLDIAKDWIIHG